MIVDSLQEFCGFLNKIAPILAIDLGEKKIGFGISDRNYRMSLPADGAKVLGDKAKIDLIISMARKHKACALVIGLPFNMDGTESPQTAQIIKFVKALESKIDLPIYLQDERVTSKAAHSLLKQMGMKRKDRDAVDDSVAASLILDTVLKKISL